MGGDAPFPRAGTFPRPGLVGGDSVCIVVPLDISHHSEGYSGNWFTEQIATGLVGKVGQATKKAAEPGA